MKKILLKIVLSLLIFLMVFNLLLVIYVKERIENIVLKEVYKKIEYGVEYNPKLEDLIDLNQLKFLDESKILIESNMDIEENKNYAKVGKYNINVSYKDMKLVQVVDIIDTTAPELLIQEIIEIDYDTDLATYEFKKYITTSDLSELKDYVIDLSKVNSSSSGEYETVISIEDIYGNKTEKQFKIKILEKIEEDIKEGVAEKKDEEVKKKTTTSSKKSEIETQKNETTTSEKKENNLPRTEEKDVSNNSATEEKKEDKKEDNNKDTEYTIVLNPNKCTHGDENYYDTREEAIAQYKNKVKECTKMLENNTIKTYEEYIKVCPYGYQDLSCPYCGRWTIKMYYR